MYKNLLLSARESADKRFAEKGLNESSFQSFSVDEGKLVSKVSAGLINKRQAPETKTVEEEDDFLTKYYNQLHEQNKELKAQGSATTEVTPDLKHPKSAETLRSDTAFMSKLNTMIDKYPGLTEGEVFKIIDGESAFDPKAVSGAKAAGLFQMMPDSLAELGFTSQELLAMEPTEQLGVYEQYLKRWDYDGSYGLGIVQAAPAYRKSSPDTVVYKKGSAAWKQNPGWRSSKSGPITKRSIEAYYGRAE